jgi:ATPase subunit of ABC transporter with duplicated ATPase domains
MITIKDLEMRFGPKALFQGVNLQLMSGSRYGLIGANGSGKSTFLRILSGEESPSGGSVQVPTKCRVGILRQDQFQYEDFSLIETVLMGKPQLYDAMKRMEELLGKEHFSDAEGQEVGHLESVIAENDGYSAEASAAQLLEGLGLPTERHTHLMRQLSGGYKLRVLLAQVLFSDPEILYLDEPTNHLDLYSIKWLETYLCKYKGALVVISHDRDFINGVSTHILDVDFGGVTMYKGNYDQYLRQVDEANERREAVMEKAEKRKDELKDFVDRFKAKASKARQAQSKMKLIEKLDDEMDQQNLQPTSRRHPQLGFRQERPSGSIPLKVEGLSKSYGVNKVLNNVSFEVDRGECLALVGPNGIGKSTLLKIIIENLSHDSGSFDWGHQVKISYFPQDIEAEVNGKGTVLEWIHHECSGETDGSLRKYLARSLFSGDDSSKTVANLSGGERARLILARMMAQQPNVLVFDEPTNHLDLESIESLRDAIKNFEGTVLLVSHNRWFVSHLAERVLEILPNEVRMHIGGYDQMLKQSGEDHLDRDVKRPTSLQRQGHINEAELKAIRQKEREISNKISKAELRIGQLESQLEKFNTEMLEEGFYDESNAWKRKQTLGKQQKVQEDLMVATAEWETLGTQLEQIRQSLP